MKRFLVLAGSALLLVAVAVMLLRAAASRSVRLGCDTEGRALLKAGAYDFTVGLPGLHVGRVDDGNCDSGDYAIIELDHPDYSAVVSFLKGEGCEIRPVEHGGSIAVCTLGAAIYEIYFNNVDGRFEGDLYLHDS